MYIPCSFLAFTRTKPCHLTSCALFQYTTCPSCTTFSTLTLHIHPFEPTNLPQIFLDHRIRILRIQLLIQICKRQYKQIGFQFRPFLRLQITTPSVQLSHVIFGDWKDFPLILLIPFPPHLMDSTTNQYEDTTQRLRSVLEFHVQFMFQLQSYKLQKGI